MSSDNSVLTVPLSKLSVHPINRQIYLNDENRHAELLESIKEQGVLEPLVVTPQDGNYVILSGARRFECAKELGFETVPCIVAVVQDQVLAIIEHNRYRQKTPIEIYNESQIFRSILEPKAKDKQLSGLKQFQDNRSVKFDETIDVRAEVAKKLNVSTGYLSMLTQVVENKEKIPGIVQSLETGRETVYSAYLQLKNLNRKDVEIPGLIICQYFSGKQSLVKDIIARMSEHTCYVEPFGGMCSVLINKPKSKVEVYNDINSDVVNMLICVRDYPLDLISRLFMMPYSRWLYERMLGILDEPFSIPDVQRAADWFYLNESTISGLSDNRSTSGSWGHGVNRSIPSVIRNRLNMLLIVSKRLLDVQIEHKSYEYVFEHYDSPETFFYVDPPYYETDDAMGIHFSPKQHEELRDRLDQLQSKWLLTINDHPKVLELYEKYRIERVTVTQQASLSKDTGGFREYYDHLIVTNYPKG